MRVVSDLLEAELAPQRFKIGVVGVRQSLGKIHAAAAAERNFSVSRNQALVQRRQGDRKLDRRTRLRAAGERQLLVDHGEHTPAGGLDRDHGAVHVAERIDRRLAHYRVLAFGEVAGGNALGKRAHVKALVIAVLESGTTGARTAKGRSGAQRGIVRRGLS